MNKLDALRAEFLVLHDLTEAQINRRINNVNSQRSADLTNIKEQVAQARIALEHRLDAMNAFREQNREQAASMITREVMDQMVLGLRGQDAQQEKRIGDLEARIITESSAEAAVIRHKKGQQAITSLIVSGVIGLVALISLLISIMHITGK